MRFLLIDHQDSYSHLLFQWLWAETGIVPQFVLSSHSVLAGIPDSSWDAALLSPGPGHPREARDFGATAAFLAKHAHKPLLGICLGHQGMAVLAGAEVKPWVQPWHGKISRIRHDGQGLFENLPPEFPATRYHSLAVWEESLPSNIKVTARAAEDDCVMGLSFLDRPWHGVQFHPESIGTPAGPALLRRFLTLAKGTLSTGLSAPRAGVVPPPNPPSTPNPSLPPTRPTPPILPEAGASPSAAMSTREPGDWSDAFLAHLPRGAFYSFHLADPWAGDGAEDGAGNLFESLFAEDEWAYWLAGGEAEDLGQGWGPTRLGNASHRLELSAQGLHLHSRDGSAVLAEGDPLVLLEDLRRRRGSEPGWIGWFEYELHEREGDRSLGAWLWPACEFSREPGGQGWRVRRRAASAAEAEAWFEDMRPRLSARGRKAGEAGAATPGNTEVTPWSSSLTRGEYGRAYRSIQAALLRGDSYEACLTLTASRRSPAHPLAVYRRLLRSSPAPFHAYVRIGDRALLSASPELFLACDGEGSLASAPIKGTRKRGEDAESDEALRRELEGSPKDRSENLMITDLVRNDLGRVCAPGSVEVTSFQALRPFQHVWQMVSEVKGRLLPGKGLADILRAAFPGGSMTGAPKIRSMEILKTAEGRPRGIYSGTFGVLSGDGSFTLAMVIRSLIWRSGLYEIGCGGAVVRDSDEEGEWREAWLKAEALQQALDGVEREGG